MERIFLKAVPAVLELLAGKAFDGIKLSSPMSAREYRDGSLSFMTCGFPGFLDSDLRALIFRSDELEFLCHARLTFRPCSAINDLMTVELDDQTLSKILQGTGVHVINNAGQAYFQDFFYSMEGELMTAFRQPENEIKLIA